MIDLFLVKYQVHGLQHAILILPWVRNDIGASGGCSSLLLDIYPGNTKEYIHILNIQAVKTVPGRTSREEESVSESILASTKAGVTKRVNRTAAHLSSTFALFTHLQPN